MGFERVRDDAAGAIAEAKALGASWVVCPWISHDKVFTREDALKSAEVFNKFAAAAEAAGLRFAYHCHGYEMLPSPEGTRFDTLAQNTDPKRVMFQVDVFHALHGGTDPVALINRYAGRVTSLHLKDLRGGRHHERHRDGHSGRRRAARHGTSGLARGPSRRDEGRRVTLLYRGRERRSLGTHPAERRLPERAQAVKPGPSAKVIMMLSYVHGSGSVPLLGETIGAALDRAAARFGDRDALISCHQNLRYTYARAAREANRAARALLALGVERGDRVGIWSANAAEWLIVQYAAAKVGAILVNVNPSYRLRELEYALNQSGVSVLVDCTPFPQNRLRRDAHQR